MESVQVMVEEHRNVKRMLAVVRRMCLQVLKDKPVDYDDFHLFIDFVRNYTDKHHHGKEEALLFDRMEKELGPVAQKLIRHGMLVEHNFARLYIQELEDALRKVQNRKEEAKLDLIANAVSYTHLMYRHIDKEDRVAYTFAEKNLSAESQAALDQACAAFEQEAAENNTQSKYIGMLESLEKKYNIQ
jgi:hemerythrin-like domain-containing protein